MAFWNDNNAGIRGNGNLTLGMGGRDDGAYDATHTYGKKDFWASVNIWALPAALPTTSLTEANVRAAVGLYHRTYTAGGGITPKLPLFLSELLPLHRTFVGVAPSVASPHGFKLLDLVISYSVATADATSLAVVFTTETPQANNTARAALSTTPLGAITYENPIGTVAATLPVAQQANPYVCRIVPAAPVFVNTDRSLFTAEIQMSLPNNCVLTLTEISAHYTLAAY